MDLTRGVFARLERRYTGSGLALILEDPAVGMRVAVAAGAAAVLNAVLHVVVFAWADEPALVVASAVLMAGYLVGAGIFWATGRVRPLVLIILWLTLPVTLVGHLLLGGYLWSGGYLLWGVATTVVAALWLDRRATLAVVIVYTVTALALAPLEPALRDSREQPLLALSIFILVDMFLVAMWQTAPPILALVDQVWREQARNRELMLNILPVSVADRLKETPEMIADRHDACTIVFADLSGFTAHAKGKDPAQVVGELNVIFTQFDALASLHRAEKIKTIGDGYMAACGLPDADPDHVAQACDLGLAMVDAMSGLNAELGTDFGLRVGVHTGSAIAGVVGTSTFSYDVWGDTVNLASRLESNGTPGWVVTSAAVVEALEAFESDYLVERIGTKDLKGQGPTEFFRLASRELADR
jgi:guanylate cyclase